MNNKISTTDFRFHQQELCNVLADISARITSPSRQTFPSRFSSYLWHHLGNRLMPVSINVAQGVGQAIRQVHDFYGWMAKHGRNGKCAGALYRSVGFMKIPSADRNGTKSVGRNIHIEHTVPIAVLRSHLKYSIEDLHSTEALHWTLIQHSICVALTYEEERKLDLAGVSKSSNEAFTLDGRQLHEFPFRRYLPMASYCKENGFDFHIVDITLGTEVDLENFTFTDHQKTLDRAAKMVKSSANHTYDVFGLKHFIEDRIS